MFIPLDWQPLQSSPPGRNDCPVLFPGSVKLLTVLVVASCGEAMPMEVELTGPDDSQGEEKPERNPPSLHIEELLTSLV